MIHHRNYQTPLGELTDHLTYPVLRGLLLTGRGREKAEKG